MLNSNENMNIKREFNQEYVDLINIYFQKKFKCDGQTIYISQINVDEIKEMRVKVEKIGSNKRLEENLKFVYKGVMKLMRTEFNQSYNLRVSKESNMKFFEFYFGNFAQENQTLIEFYFDPLNTGKYLKTINFEYL